MTFAARSFFGLAFGPVPIAYSGGSMLALVLLIFDSGGPTEIALTIVGPVTIVVSCVMLWAWCWAVERLAYNAIDPNR